MMGVAKKCVNNAGFRFPREVWCLRLEKVSHLQISKKNESYVVYTFQTAVRKMQKCH